jgi:site-specific recombinase XerD
MTEFLDSYSNKSTRRMYRRGLELFCKWYGKDVDTILKERKDDLTPRPDESFVDTKQRASRYEKLLEKFHGWLLEQSYKINTARTMCLGIMQLFRYYNMGITLRTGSPVSQTVVTTSDFILQPEHVRAMFHAAKDLRSKLLVSMGNDFGWRISDILSIKRSELPNLKQEPPIEWIRITKKEKVVAKSCLSKTTVTLLKEYLFSFPTKNPYLFHSNTKNHISDETVNARLRDLARDAGIELGNLKLRWHCFRKMIISQAKNSGIDPDIIKLMVGKSVKKDMLTYMTGIDVKTAFNKMQEVSGISAFTEESESMVKAMESEIKELKQAMVRLQQDGQAYKKANEVLTERLNEYEARLKDHGEVLKMVPTMQRQIAYLKGRIVKKKPRRREEAVILT